MPFMVDTQMITLGSKGSLRRRLSLAMIQAADSEQYSAAIVSGFQWGFKFFMHHPAAWDWGSVHEYRSTDGGCLIAIDTPPCDVRHISEVCQSAAAKVSNQPPKRLPELPSRGKSEPLRLSILQYLRQVVRGAAVIILQVVEACTLASNRGQSFILG